MTAAQLRRKLNRPDIVAHAIALASAEQAVREAFGNAPFRIADAVMQPVPKLQIKPGAQGAAVKAGSAAIAITLEAAPSPVKAIRIQVNGRQIEEQLPKTGGGFAPGDYVFSVPLAKGDNNVAVTAVSEAGEHRLRRLRCMKVFDHSADDLRPVWRWRGQFRDSIKIVLKAVCLGLRPGGSAVGKANAAD